jgi:hypothetical protein
MEQKQLFKIISATVLIFCFGFYGFAQQFKIPYKLGSVQSFVNTKMNLKNQKTLTINISNEESFIVDVESSKSSMHKYYLFGKDGAKNLAVDLEVPFLGNIPIVQSVREAGDFGRPVAMQEDTIVSKDFKLITQNVVSEVVKRNKNLPITEAIKITTMAGCSAVNK